MQRAYNLDYVRRSQVGLRYETQQMQRSYNLDEVMENSDPEKLRQVVASLSW